MVTRIFWVAFCVLFAWCGIAHPEDVKIRLVYLKDGRPAIGQRVELYFGNPQSAPPILYGTTDAYGVAVFHLSDSLPHDVWADPGYGHVEGCARNVDTFALEDVIRAGRTIGVDEAFGQSCKGDRS